MAYRTLITALLFLPYWLGAQTNISGVVNNYYKVIEVVTTKACVRVDNVSGLGNSDLVMIIQMKGATVATANNSTFGSVSALNNAGNYELVNICSIRGDSVFLFKQLAQTYTPSDKVQLVRVPQYASAQVVDTLKALPWDSASGKGGVLAISVVDDLILNAPVSASGQGFAGGAYMTSNGTCFNFVPADNYYYNATLLAPQDGAYKGEGISSLSISYSGGKGAAANGGGGGNNHNNGGGGGSNLSAGGSGGGNSSATGCTVSNPAKGGYALSSNSGNKIYLGGGGGAGHANSGFASTGGGDGGGIIFIHADNLISNGYKIMSNGMDGGNTTGDGASGGGAGGSVLLDINTYADALNAEAKGGNGGNENDDFTAQRCYGEGGGGSGGVVYLKTSTPSGATINIAGGAKGNRLNSVSCGTIVNGSNGISGSIVQNYAYVQSSTLSTNCGVFLDVQLVRFDVKATGQKVSLSWQVANPWELNSFKIERKMDNNSWFPIQSVQASSSNMDYYFQDHNLQTGDYYYRLKMFEKAGAEKYSVVRSVTIHQAKLSLYPNPANNIISIVYPFRAGSRLKIYDDMGRMVFENTIASPQNLYRQDISFLQKGFYYLLIDDHKVKFSIR